MLSTLNTQTLEDGGSLLPCFQYLLGEDCIDKLETPPRVENSSKDESYRTAIWMWRYILFLSIATTFISYRFSILLVVCVGCACVRTYFQYAKNILVPNDYFT